MFYQGCSHNELYRIHYIGIIYELYRMSYTNCNSKITEFKESDIYQLSDTLKN